MNIRSWASSAIQSSSAVHLPMPPLLANRVHRPSSLASMAAKLGTKPKGAAWWVQGARKESREADGGQMQDEEERDDKKRRQGPRRARAMSKCRPPVPSPGLGSPLRNHSL